jgi:polyvinyl alcohol dehydrogenase (cytochrome)
LTRSRRATLAACVPTIVALLAAAPAARAAEQNAYAVAMNYATPVVAIGQGDTLTFHNLDSLAKHDLVGHDGSFASPLIDGGKSAPVEGVDKLSPGSYPFHCTLHNWMQGTLNVGSAGGGGGGGPELPGLGGGGGGGTGSTAPDPYDIYPRASKQPLGPGNWPRYGKDYSNSRNGGENGPTVAQAANLGIAWSHWSTDGDFTGTPVVSNGTLIAGSSGGTVFALDAATGKAKWHRDLIGEDREKEDTAINASASIYRGRVYIPVVQVGKPRLVALSLKTGRKLFDTVIGDQPMMDTYGSPVGWAGRLYMGTSGYFAEFSSDTKARGSVVAVHWKTGKLLWRTFTVPEGHNGGAVWSTPAIDTKRRKLYVGTGNAYTEPVANTTDSMLKMNPRTGRILRHFQATAGDAWNGPDDWPENPDADFGASPNLFEGPDGRLLVGQGQKSGRYWALDRQTMEPVWDVLTGPGTFTGGIVGSTAFDSGRIYGPDTHGGESWAIDRNARRLAWFSADGGPLHFNATSTANGVVYTTDMSGFLMAREASTGVLLAKIPLGSPSWAGVSIAGGSVFTATGLQSGSGYLVAYRPRTGNELNEPADHWEDNPPPDENEINRPKGRKKKTRTRSCKSRREHAAHGHSHGGNCKKKRRKKGRGGQGGHGQQGGGGGEGHSHDPGPGGGPLRGISRRSDRYVPKPPGTTERLTLYFGPYKVPPGWDANRVDIDLPVRNGFMMSVDPSMRRTIDGSEPTHREAHIHHAHWFRPDPGNQEDQYFRGNAEWIFGNGDEETKGDFRPRSRANAPNGPVYGQYIAGEPQNVIYMLHNKTAQPLSIYIVLDITFRHGNPAQLQQITGREHRDVKGLLWGRTYDVPRQAGGDGRYEYPKDNPDARPSEVTAQVDGTIIGMGGHLHPGGLRVVVENLGSEENPCPRTGSAPSGTLLLNSDARFVNAPYSEDFQMEVTHPAFRAPIRKGDRLRIHGIYENKDHAWYDVMTHLGVYIDEKQPPRGHCKPRLKRRVKWKVTEGVMNRGWDTHEGADICGEEHGRKPCEKPVEGGEPPEIRTNTVQIANFRYVPGDAAGSGSLLNGIPTIKQGDRLTFVNEDQAANIRHSATTCPWPCNGKYVANYPLPDGVWDSGTLGYDVIDGGSPNPTSQTPPELPAGTYSYFCRIHPWMRGAFKVVE